MEFLPAMLVLAIGSSLAQEKVLPQEVVGLVHIPSRYSVAETVERLELELNRRGLEIFARIDFEADAREAGLEMRPTRLLIFGNPKIGTPLMNAEPTVAIDLPMKALAWQDADGNVWLSYNSPDYLQERHHLTPGLLEKMKGIGGLFESVGRGGGQE